MTLESSKERRLINDEKIENLRIEVGYLCHLYKDRCAEEDAKCQGYAVKLERFFEAHKLKSLNNKKENKRLIKTYLINWKRTRKNWTPRTWSTRKAKIF